jgi:hypothetical protein
LSKGRSWEATTNGPANCKLATANFLKGVRPKAKGVRLKVYAALSLSKGRSWEVIANCPANCKLATANFLKGVRLKA